MLPRTMTRHVLLLLLTILFSSEASIYYSPILSCADFADDLGNQQSICSTSSGWGPSPGMLENGTVIYIGSYGRQYEYWVGLPEGTDTTTLGADDSEQYSMGVTTVIQWEEGGAPCTVTVNDVACLSCTFCEPDVYSADCSNAPNGRVVECASLDPVFFPFYATTLAFSATPLVPSRSPSPGLEITVGTEVGDAIVPAPAVQPSFRPQPAPVSLQKTSTTEPTSSAAQERITQCALVVFALTCVLGKSIDCLF